ncbi:MAG: hypothetical protein KAH22_00845 [Thiotrichaceae bacterium]|nr:hypothetical protein [Thiotrichaceae bacterium]
MIPPANIHTTRAEDRSALFPHIQSYAEPRLSLQPPRHSPFFIQTLLQLILTLIQQLQKQGNIKREIPLNKQQNQRALSLFGYIAQGNEKARIFDKDGNGKISVGDVVKLGSQERTLNKAMVRQITQPPRGERLKLDRQQSEQALAIFNPPVSRSMHYFVKVFDSNPNGKVSKGDTAILMRSPSVAPSVEGYNNSEFEIKRIRLTATQAAQINKEAQAQPLKLSEAEHNALSARFNRIPPPNLFDAPTLQFTGTVIDKNKDGQLSVGDIVKLRTLGGNMAFIGDSQDTIHNHTLTAEDLAFIKSDRSHPLLTLKEGRLSSEQQQGLVKTLNIDNGHIDKVYDNNSDGKLSAGDTLSILSPGARTPLAAATGLSIKFHTLTQANIDQFLQNAIDPITPVNRTDAVSGGGVSIGTDYSNNINLANDQIVKIKGQSYSIGFLKDQVDHYANSSFAPKGITDSGFGIFSWGTSNSFAAGSAFERYMTEHFPSGEK